MQSTGHLASLTKPPCRIRRYPVPSRKPIRIVVLVKSAGLPALFFRKMLRYTRCVHSEHLLISFMKRSKRERYREILSQPRLRHKFTNQLAHFKDFDPKYRLAIPSNQLHVGNIAHELQKRHSPGIVYAISENSGLDQKELPLMDALEEIVGRGMGTVLSCIPGRLAFVETEDERFIMERHDPLENHKYVRFVIGKGEQGEVERGIFHVVMLALEWKEITGPDADELNKLSGWFDKNLKKPASSGRDPLRRGVCWFKTNSTEHIARIEEMAAILERNGVIVRKISTDKPRFVVYEDEWQLVAEPPRKKSKQT
jgi:hypothetical protein